MSIDEQVRSDLFIGLQATLGSEPARLLMSAIPPFSWDDVAMRSDLDRFATKLDLAEFRGQVQALISKGQMSLFFQIAALNLSTAGIVIAALKFLP